MLIKKTSVKATELGAGGCIATSRVYQVHWLALLGGVFFLPCTGFAETGQGDDAVFVEPPAQDLRSRLTEREDETRVERPWTRLIFGHPLSATVQYELSVGRVRQRMEDNPPDRETRSLLEQEAEAEFFYTLGPQLSFLAQARASMEKNFLRNVQQGSDSFFERGEMWLYAQPIDDFPFTLEIGRLDFEDDRRWWWDEDLDALRITAQSASIELTLAVARELGPTRSDRSFVEAEKEAVQRLIVEAAWDLNADHSIHLFTLVHDDRSRSPQVGESVDSNREDDSDAQLTWHGARATGAWASKPNGALGYWIDAAALRGTETVVSLDPLSREAGERIERDVRGWAFDLGATWVVPVAFDPRFTVGYALGSGDSNAADACDCAFRQTGVQSNMRGFGGVQSFAGYGALLDPGLSNLAILTAGVGVSLFAASSLDFVYHDYRQVEPTNSLRNARLNASLTGQGRDLGYGLDAVLAVEEWDRFQLEASASAFRAGTAFGIQHGQWTFGGFVALRVAF